jgi:hypothetical protein
MGMSQRSKKRRVRMLGVGLDNEDGHIRITQGENFSVWLGSEATHERLRETCIKINEHLKRRGKDLQDISAREFSDLVKEVQGD